ncbi:hypothetical protein LCGC14_3161530 [marine sediment metagenome]|uniref:Uncharacterized protein n=1 Tax=marine sediment metagenome TaxID=412755 RepID=A0A0F8VR03_9ZZZZ
MLYLGVVNYRSGEEPRYYWYYTTEVASQAKITKLEEFNIPAWHISA